MFPEDLLVLLTSLLAAETVALIALGVAWQRAVTELRRARIQASSASAKLEGQLSEERDRVLELMRSRRDVTAEVMEFKDIRRSDGYFSKSYLVKVGYKIQYRVDGIPIAATEPTITHTDEMKQIDHQRIDQFTNAALEAGQRLLQAANPIGSVSEGLRGRPRPRVIDAPSDDPSNGADGPGSP